MRWLLLILSLVLSGLRPAPASADWNGLVLDVLDGDTMVLSRAGGERRVRLYGVDAPEKAQAAGAEAGQARVDSIDTDRYGRTVARVKMGRRWASEYRLRAGLVWVYPEYCLRRECRK
ncbi:MAG: hypothetical protein AB1505_32175 [Candidatus Latescibacterota bacterium]